ncbi:MAG: hypothetical protein ACKOPS_14045, partial [Cyanobium sp.]
LGGTTATGQHPAGDPLPPVLVHPPGASFAEPYLEQLAALIPAGAGLKVVVGHVNPNRVALLRQLAARWPALMLVASNAGAKLLNELWSQQKPQKPAAVCSDAATAGDAAPDAPAIPPLPPIDVVKQEASRPLGHGHVLRLLPVPTPRWPGGLVAFEESAGLLMSGKFFAAPAEAAEHAHGLGPIPFGQHGAQGRDDRCGGMASQGGGADQQGITAADRRQQLLRRREFAVDALHPHTGAGDALAYLGCRVAQRLEGPDHWIIYAEVEEGNVADTEASTAVHHRKVGNHY